jgi:accessory colonization factor AcfC
MDDKLNDDLIGMGRKKKEDLYKAYLRVIEKHGVNARHMSRSSLYEEAANSMAPRFYVTAFRAGIIINEMVKEEQNARCKSDTPGECAEVSGAV